MLSQMVANWDFNGEAKHQVKQRSNETKMQIALKVIL